MRYTEEQFSAMQSTHHNWKLREVNALSRVGAGSREAPGGLVHVGTPARGTHPKAKLAPPTYPLIGLCRSLHLPIPEKEYRFHLVRGWLFDYAWPTHLLALEVEGGVWRKGGGAHSHPLGIERDHEKYSEAAILGWRVLHVQPDDLATIGIDYLTRAFPR